MNIQQMAASIGQEEGRPLNQRDEERGASARRRDELPAAAQRALKEAEERRKKAAAEQQAPAPREVGGRNGPDPARYGDWEVKGIASDF